MDAKRGKIFSKWAKLIMSASRQGGSDAAMNLPLRYAIERAKADNMPNDSIERAVKKGAGELDGPQPEDVLYEAYGQGGVAIMIETLTDNRNRTIGNLRQVMVKKGGTMGNAGSVAYMFERKATFAILRGGVDEDEIMELALELGADDVTTDEPEIFGVEAEPGLFIPLKEAFDAKGYELVDAAIRYVPENEISVDLETTEKLQILIDAIEDDDDVQAVHHNADFAE